MYRAESKFMAYTNPEVANQLPFPEEAAAAIRAALGDAFTVTSESGVGDVTYVEGTSFQDPDGLSPVVMFEDTGEGATFRGNDEETLDRFISGTSGDDNFTTAGGDDEIMIGAGNDTVDGGVGTDVVIVNGAFNPDRVQVQDDGSILIDNGNGQVATVRNTEVVQFEDTKVVVSDNVKDGAIALLYEAAFDRQLDNAGYKFWTREGADLTTEEIAEFFTRSEEFQGLFADATNEEFVAQIYANFFDREADEAGFEFYVGLLNDGSIDRGDFLADIADSSEAFTLFEEIVKIIGSSTSDTTDESGTV
jgi:Ca2+-binding RTX toxin-like protein